jgi:hypothetical protein
VRGAPPAMRPEDPEIAATSEIVVRIYSHATASSSPPEQTTRDRGERSPARRPLLGDLGVGREQVDEGAGRPGARVGRDHTA